MRGADTFTESLFTMRGLDDLVPKNHPLRPVRLMVNQALKNMEPLLSGMYAADIKGGRPSIAPEKLLRAMLLQIFYSIRSERMLMEQTQYNLLFRWFIGLSMDDTVWVPTVFTKNRERLIEHDAVIELFNEVLHIANKNQWLSGEHFSVDGTLIQAWAGHKSFRAKDGNEGDPGNFKGQRRSNETHESTTDADARLYCKGDNASRLRFMGHTLADNRHGLIANAVVTTADGSAEREAAKAMIADAKQGADDDAQITLGADKGYDAAEFIEALTDMKVVPLIASNEQGQPAITIGTQSATDNIDVTAYCITSSASAPTAKDSCFAEERRWTRAIGPSWYVWARDAAGNVSAAQRAPGPCSAAAVEAAKASVLPTVCMRTDAGDIVIELESSKAPNTVNNFAQYVVDGFYAGTIFHRIISNFMVQGGGFKVSNGSRVQKTEADGLRSAITLEKTTDTALSNLTGTLAMARTNEPNSATSQFFINVVDNKALDADGSTAPGNGYDIFGKVIYGMDSTVQSLRNSPVTGNGSGETSSPTQNLFIQWAYLLN